MTEPRTLGPYTLLRELGRGGQAQVFLAEDGRLGRKVALKVFGAVWDNTQLGRIQREAAAASRLDHPGICGIYEAGEVDGKNYIAMRYVEGESLAQLITARKERHEISHTAPTGPSSRDELMRLLEVFEQAARSLHAAHEAGLIHRDVKPGNIMISNEGRPVILDFGLARDETGSLQTLTAAGDLMGTPAYMSPEQLAAQRIRLDRRTDVYSLGVALFECLTLRWPFEGPTLDALYQQILAEPPPDPIALNPRIPRDLKVVLDTALDKDRTRRYQTALDFAEDLRRVRAFEPIRARPVGALLRLRRWSQRNPAYATGIVAAFVLLSVGLAIALTLLGRVREEQERTESVADRLRALALAHASNQSLETNPMRALILAREAVLRLRDSRTVTQLHRALAESRERVRFVGHSGPIHAIAFSPEGDALATASDDGTARIWNRDGSTRAVLTHGDAVHSVAFAADGTRIVTASEDKTATLWDPGGNRLAALEHDEPVRSAVFAPDGRTVLTVSFAAHLWDVEGRRIRTFAHGGTRVWSAVFSKDGARILTAGADGKARLRDRAGRELLVLDEGDHDRLLDARFLEGGGFVTWSDGLTRLWSADGEAGHAWGHDVACFDVAPDGDSYAVGGSDHELTVVDATEEADATRAVWHTAGVTSIAYSRASDRVVSTSEDGTARVFWSDLEPIAVLAGHARGASAAAFGPGDGLVATGSNTGTVRLWDTRGGEVATLVVHAGVAALACSEGDREILAVARKEGWVQRWNEAARSFRRVPTARPWPVRDAVWLGRDRVVIVHGGSAFVYDSASDSPIRNRASKREVGAFKDVAWEHALALPDGDRFVAWGKTGEVCHADGRRLVKLGRSVDVHVAADRIAVLDDAGVVRLFDFDGEEAGRIEGFPAPASRPRIRLSPDARTLAGCSTESGRVHLCDVATGREWYASGVDGGLRDIAWSPDGMHLVGAALDATAGVWKRDGALRARLSGHQGEVTRAEFSSRGDRILTSSKDGTARLWDLDGNEIAVFQYAQATFSRAGDRLLTVSPYGVVGIWHVYVDDVLALANERITRDLTEPERVRVADLLDGG